MPTKPSSTPTPLEKMTAAQILNTTRDTIGGEYASMVPRAVAPGDTLPNGRVATEQDALMTLRGIGQIIMTYQPLQNALISALVNRIARVIVTSRLYDNPWRFFKQGLLEYGETVEEIFVNLAKPFQYDPVTAEDEVFKRVIPDVKARFHSMNYQKFYKVSVSNDQLRQAFLSWQGITDLISRIIETLYTGANYDEFCVMKYLIAKMALSGHIYTVQIDTVTAANARAVTTGMVNQALKLQFMSSEYNDAGVMTYTDPSYLYTILTTDISALFDVEVLALSFNMDKAELLGRQVLVDGFGQFDTTRLAQLFQDDPYTIYTPFTSSELTLLSSIKALMIDRAWFMIFDNYYNMTEIYNPQGLYWNYYYHVWKTFSTSGFANALLFTTTTSSVTAVTITPATTTAVKGQKVAMSATATGTGFANQKVTWAISGGTSSTISADGVVSIGDTETAATLTVTATSVMTPTVSGTATITVSGNTPPAGN